MQHQDGMPVLQNKHAKSVGYLKKKKATSWQRGQKS